jgi:4-amino-4-deoxy-L-arabinose transferase-like glycosyltransferase
VRIDEMLDKKLLFQAIWQQIYRWVQFPYCSLIAWMLPLLLFSSGESSLIAHDEALYAWRSRLMIDSGDWVAPWGHAHHKTPGIYWLIATTYKLFGMSEASARLPSMIAGVCSLLIFYEIANILLGRKVAWLAAAILSVEFLWLQYCRLASPDVPMILLVLLAILALLKAEIYPKYNFIWIFLAGLSFGLGFLVRSFMIFLSIIAILPYLIGENHRHRHLANPMLYLGFAVGLAPTFIWLWLSWLRYSDLSIMELFSFIVKLSSEDRNQNGILFYLWNIPLKSFPWSIFSILGFVVACLRPIARYHLILVGFPVVLFGELSIFSTRLSHYALCLYPFIALLAAVGLTWLGRIYNLGLTQQKRVSPGFVGLVISMGENLPRIISYAFGVISILFLLGSIFVGIVNDRNINRYATILLISGFGWLTVPLIWIIRHYFGQKLFTDRFWIGSYLITCWLSLAVAGISGFLSDYNPEFRVFFQQKAIASILQTHPVYFAQANDKNSILLQFYTPIPAPRVDAISQVPPASYAWISPPKTADLSPAYRVIGSIQDYQLIQVLPSN